MKKDLAALLQNNPEFDLSICKILNDKQLESLENNIVLFLHGKTLDMGTKDLSILLLKELLCSLSQQELLPKTIILSQKTVLCNQRESEFLHFFRLLEQKNIEITDKTKEEFVDCLHFLISLGQDIFKDEQEMFDWYCKKNDKNLLRQKTGY